MTIRHILAHATTVAIMMFVVPSASAEAIFINTGGEEIGQGWLFRDPTTGRCGVVTAKHVVASGAQPLIVARDGREAAVAEVVDLGTDLDVVLLRITGPIVEHGCTSSTLGSRRLDAVLARRPRLTIENVDRAYERTWTPARLVAQDGIVRDIVVLQADGDEVKKGYSGSPVIEDPDGVRPGIQGLPIAMITSVSPDGRASAVRFDKIRALVEPAIRRDLKSTITAEWQVIDWSGQSDAICAAANALKGDAPCGWKSQRPASGSPLSIDFRRDSASPLSHIILRTNGISKVTIETSPEVAGDLIWAKSCKMGADGGRCAFSEALVRRVRLSFVMTQDDVEIMVPSLN